MRYATNIFVLMVFTVTLNAKVIEINQLFNKSLTAVKKEHVGAKKQFYGNIKIDESKVYDVVTRFDGYITQINSDKTLMHVKKDAILFSVYSDELMAIKNELNITRKINKNLYQSALDKLYALDIHPTQINALLQSKKKTANISVHAPFDGIVLKKSINAGSPIKKGQVLLQLADIKTLWFIAQVYQKDLSFIKDAMTAKIKVEGINKAFTAKVDYIYPFVNKKNKTVDVRFVLENKNLILYPNMFATAQLQQTQKSMLTLPKSAVLNKGSKYYVFKPVSQSEFEPLEVEVKRISSSKYQIISGIGENEQVINNALFLLDSDALTNALYEENDDDDW
jgi:Cu(I)/Ag(I) efflux system membrane fusion protein